MPCPSYFSWFGEASKILWWVRTIKLSRSAVLCILLLTAPS
jgi:hypothetical protein